MVGWRAVHGILLAAASAWVPLGATEPVGMVDEACPAMPPVPAVVAQWNEALLGPGPLDRAALSSRLQQDAEAQAYQRAQQAWAARDWAKLCRYRADNRDLLATGRPVQAVFLGDSITDNWPRADPALFDAHGWVGRGISGQTSAQMLVRFQADVVALRPRWVHILAGTNDVAGNGGPTTVQDFRNNIMAMVQLARANGIAVVLGAIPPARRFSWRPEVDAAPRIAELNAWLKAYAQQQGLGFVDYHAALARDGDLPPAYGHDGVHPNRDGYAVMRRWLLQAAAAAEPAGKGDSSSSSAPSRGAL